MPSGTHERPCADMGAAMAPVPAHGGGGWDGASGASAATSAASMVACVCIVTCTKKYTIWTVQPNQVLVQNRCFERNIKHIHIYSTHAARTALEPCSDKGALDTRA